MSRQHTAPYVVTDSTSQPLKLDHDTFNERWLRDFIFSHSEALPIAEIEPAFGSLIPVCVELGTRAGPIDILFVNSDGLLTLVECKLWNNPEARRAVIGQILDYAKELSSWSYEELERKITTARQGNGDSLYQLVAIDGGELDESEFIDNVKRNLMRGRFLLLIVGSGIREGVERITEFLQRHAHLNFGMALVEVGIFRLPEQVGGGHLVLPRVVAQTVEVVRNVIRIEGGKIVAELPPEAEIRETGKIISEQVFYEALAKVDPNTCQDLKRFLDGIIARNNDFSVKPVRASHKLQLMFTLYDVELNLGQFGNNSTFKNFAIAYQTEQLGYPEIGETYLTKLAALFKDAYVNRTNPNKKTWTVTRPNNRRVTIAELLAVQDKWLEIIQDTTDQLLKAQEKED